MSDDIRIPRPGEWCPCGQHGLPHREKDHELLSKGGNVVAKPVFEEALRGLLNSYSKENDSNTPDFILANYIHRCLETWAITTRERERWYGIHLAPGGKVMLDTKEASIGGLHIKCGPGEQERETIKPMPPLAPLPKGSIGCFACKWSGSFPRPPEGTPPFERHYLHEIPCPHCVPTTSCIKCGKQWGVVECCCSIALISDDLHVKGVCTACCDGALHDKKTEVL